MIFRFPVSNEIWYRILETRRRYLIHQVVLRIMHFRWMMMIGTDSHTVNAGGLGMIAIGVGGADACDDGQRTSWN